MRFSLGFRPSSHAMRACTTSAAAPAAFTAATGPAHWELLCRARAVENQLYVVGAAQVGDLSAGKRTP